MNRLQKGMVFFALVVLAAAYGFDAAAQAGPYQFYALTPCRVVDTRPTAPAAQQQGGIVTAGGDRFFTFQTKCGVPAGAKAVTVNLTVVGPTQGGFVSLFPAGPRPVPMISTINFATLEPAIANGAIVPLAAATPDLGLVYGSLAGVWTTHVILDVTGYFAP